MTSSQTYRQTYRRDLDGVRGIAIAMVLLYHLSEFRFPGGFVGVDVFFALSGYLITQVIHSDIRGGVFIFRTFVYRRMRRLFPSLIVTLLMTMLLGAFLLQAYERTRLGLYVISAVTFTTNFVALADTSYFFPTAEQPLIHLWSLAVEEHFYVLLPLLLLFLQRMRWSVRTALWLVVAVSMIANLVLTNSGSELAFFLSPARFWQLGAGSLVALYFPLGSSASRSIKRLEPLAGISALATLLAATFLINERLEYPGLAALIPTISTIVLLRVGGSGSIVTRLLSFAPLRYLGLISYPLYLFHYPLLSLYQRGATSFERLLTGSLAILAASILAVLTYHFVEHPIRFGGTGISRLDVRRRRDRPTRSLGTWAGLLCAGLFLTGLIGLSETRAVSRLSAGSLIADLNYVAVNPDWDQRCLAVHTWQSSDYLARNGCAEVDPTRSRRVLLWGDSHAGSLAPGLRSYLNEIDTDLLQITAGGCEPLWDSRFFPTPECSSIVNFAKAAITESRPDFVILHSRWDLVLRSIDELGLDRESVIIEFLTSIQSTGGPEILLVGPVPTFSDALPSLLLNEIQNDPSYAVPARTDKWIDRTSILADEDLRRLAKRFPDGIRYLSLIDGLCNADGCLIRVGEDPRTELLAWDYGHLTRTAAAFVTRELIASYFPRS